ncbi:helix-turn-helix transcriptional regulator [Caenimonas soli]|uniref:helix-turn-helix transcriptional regulator n=1 Tax=Caenimonas soli TaxID=2735555 RepID=UPI00155458A7|nr:helix-turn-helix domain-containing protein [Caenimonas soli]NPC57839.1 helix-turn-helix domain-containing protein [Caenimonas soli]
MTPNEVSAYIGVPTTTLSVWRSTGRVHLPFVKAGRAVRYRREEVEALLAGRSSQEASPTRRSSKAPVRAAVRRLEEFMANHDALKCERCNHQVEEAEVRIVSHLELPSLEGPRDPHDWHCFCAACHQELAREPAALWAPKLPASHPASKHLSQVERQRAI